MIRKSKSEGTQKRGTRRVRIEWLTLALIVGCYALWFVAGLSFGSMPLLTILLLPVLITFHSSLQHEVLHGHPTRNAKVNEALIFLPIGLFYPFRRYKNLHLRHHADERLTDPYDDPESYYRALVDWEKLPAWFRSLLKLNNTLAGRVIVGPAISIVGFTLAEMKLVLTGSRAIRLAWVLHVAGLVPMLLIVTQLFGMPFLVYLALAYAGLSILAIRSFCEHQWSERPDGRTVIIEKSVLGLLFLNNNLHLVHHKRPTAPWYKLPQLYRERPEEWQSLNEGYVFRNYAAVLRAFGFRTKEPVVHPTFGKQAVAAGESATVSVAPSRIPAVTRN